MLSEPLPWAGVVYRRSIREALFPGPEGRGPSRRNGSPAPRRRPRRGCSSSAGLRRPARPTARRRMPGSSDGRQVLDGAQRPGPRLSEARRASSGARRWMSSLRRGMSSLRRGMSSLRRGMSSPRRRMSSVRRRMSSLGLSTPYGATRKRGGTKRTQSTPPKGTERAPRARLRAGDRRVPTLNPQATTDTDRGPHRPGEPDTAQTPQPAPATPGGRPFVSPRGRFHVPCGGGRASFSAAGNADQEDRGMTGGGCRRPGWARSTERRPRRAPLGPRVCHADFFRIGFRAPRDGSNSLDARHDGRSGPSPAMASHERTRNP